jgi:hypothetical protein
MNLLIFLLLIDNSECDERAARDECDVNLQVLETSLCRRGAVENLYLVLYSIFAERRLSHCTVNTSLTPQQL